MYTCFFRECLNSVQHGNKDIEKRVIEKSRMCPKCGKCGATYTINPKQRAYPEETRELAIKMYYSGVSGRGVGKVLRMNKANVYNWIKKNG